MRLYTELEVEAFKRMKHLKLTDLQPTTEEFPCLRHVKGAKIRAFAPVCLELCRLYKDSRVDKHRLAMVSSLNQLYTLMGEHSWQKWGAKQGEQFLAATNTLLSHYSFLARAAMDAGEYMYSLTQKHHVLVHLAEQAQYGHPCYGSESFMAVAKAIGASCTRGTPAHKVSSKILQKFRCVFHLFLDGHFDLAEGESEDEEK